MIWMFSENSASFIAVNLPTRSASFLVPVAAEIPTAFDRFFWNVPFTFCSGLSILVRRCLGRAALFPRDTDILGNETQIVFWATDWGKHNQRLCCCLPFQTLPQENRHGMYEVRPPHLFLEVHKMQEVFLCVCLRHRLLLSSLFLFPTDAALRLPSCVRTGDKTALPDCRHLIDALLSIFHVDKDFSPQKYKCLKKLTLGVVYN